MTKRLTQIKSLSIENYLAYKAINKQHGLHSDEMDLFLTCHDLPTRDNLSEDNLFMYIPELLPVIILNLDEMKQNIILDKGERKAEEKKTKQQQKKKSTK